MQEKLDNYLLRLKQFIFSFLDPRQNMESSAGMSDQMSSCNSDYAPSSNSGSSGNYTDD